MGPERSDGRHEAVEWHARIAAMGVVKREPRLTRGRFLVAHRSDSGAGSLLVQLARDAGARVIAAARGDRKLALARDLGAELAVDYAKKREQFDRPIASFQAIKHFAADMHARQEMARAAVYAAGATCDDPSVGDVVRAVASARVVAGEAAMKNARMCIQIYGGMGYTWEMPPHYYLKRAFVLEGSFGSGDEHCETVAERIDL